MESSFVPWICSDVSPAYFPPAGTFFFFFAMKCENGSRLTCFPAFLIKNGTSRESVSWTELRRGKTRCLREHFRLQVNPAFKITLKIHTDVFGPRPSCPQALYCPLQDVLSLTHTSAQVSRGSAQVPLETGLEVGKDGKGCGTNRSPLQRMSKGVILELN